MSDPEEAPQAERRLEVPARAGRLDLWLAAELGVSRARAIRLLSRGAVLLENRTLSERDKGRELPAGSRLVVRGPLSAADEQIAPGSVPGLRLLAEGPGWLGFDKPPGVPVHPFAPSERGTVLNEAVRLRPEIARGGGRGGGERAGEGEGESAAAGVGEGGLRSGVVHRLDVDTSGVQVVASDEATWTRLRAAFERGGLEKRYRALVRGDLAEDRRFEGVLAVTRHRPALVSVRPDSEAGRGGARRVSQHIRVILRFGDATLLEVEPRTGYLHQIRATLAHLGHPVLGDASYGGIVEEARDDGDLLAAPRQMLHAAQLRGEGLDLEAPDPEDFAEVLARLRAHAGRR